MKLAWERHYTGIETAERGALYLRRDSKTKRICFARLSGYRWMLGVFIGRTNAIGGNGVEVFTSDLHIGWGDRSRRVVTWGGSSAEPYRRYTIHLGRFAFGSTADRWIVGIKKAIERRRWDREFERMERSENSEI